MTALKMPHDISKRLNWTVTLTLLFSSRISCNLVKPWQTACLRLPLMSALADWERKTDKERDKERDKHKQKWHSGSKKSLGQKDVRDGSRDWDGKKRKKEAEIGRWSEPEQESETGRWKQGETETLPMALQRNKVTLCVKTSSEEVSLRLAILHYCTW